LTDRFAYKLKKPVRFDFLDFSTPEARRQACLAECALNEPMAPGVYLGVVPITADAKENLAVGGEGRAVDWLVKMRRLPGNRMLDHLIRSGELAEEDTQRLAAWLADYYHRLTPACVGAWGYRHGIETHVRQNRAELLEERHRLPPELVKRCHAAQLRFLVLEQIKLDARVCDGRIVEGHGDLRPEHICLEREPLVFDCIEFNADLRRLDVADELEFLAMECDYLGAAGVGRQIVAAYQRTSGDHFSHALGNFFKSYRACVRAKVAALAAAQVAAPLDDEPRQRALAYLRLADGYAAHLGPPTAIVVCGLMGSGKTTLATGLADLLGSHYLSTDEIRRELLGTSPLPAAYNEGHYTKASRQRIYTELLHRAETLLRQGISVVLDGTFLTAALRHAAVAVARAAGAAPLVVHCNCPAAVAQERIEQRTAESTSSEARRELYAAQQAEEEPFADVDLIEIDTTEAPIVQQAAVLTALRSRVAIKE
ncbi:MAG TPA: AAA family ATPase, partial [Pirellulales bacterium]|nr:AAA family ATPase [Pirellulales bacterium]